MSSSSSTFLRFVELTRAFPLMAAFLFARLLRVFLDVLGWVVTWVTTMMEEDNAGSTSSRNHPCLCHDQHHREHQRPRCQQKRRWGSYTERVHRHVSDRYSALQGLLGSLGHAGHSSSSDTNFSAEQLQKLSEKISDILGDDADHSATQGDKVHVPRKCTVLVCRYSNFSS